MAIPTQDIPIVREWTTEHYGVTTTWMHNCRRVITFEMADERWAASARNSWNEHMKTIPPYPGNFSGRGIVICAGSVNYLTCAWVSITMLRRIGCALPVEVWFNENEINLEMIDALAEMNVVCKDVKDYTLRWRELKTYMLKAFSILHSSFKEVLFLDADNNCVTDPSCLFDSEEFKKYGAVFWPDCWVTDKDNPIYTITDYHGPDPIEQESGQVLIDKERCWKEMNLCLYFNLNPQTYYMILLGDKDTFKFAWMALRTPFYMVERHMGYAGFIEPGLGFRGMTMVQHDPAGDILFLHRNWLKWSQMLDGEAMWSVIKRFKPGVQERFIARKFIARHESILAFMDIEGEVEETSFREQFGDYEWQCLDILKQFRDNKRYGRFLLHSYFCHVREGYAAGLMDKVTKTL
jgi:alpha 1,2-mannosyltransferase